MLRPPSAYTHESRGSLDASATAVSLSYLEQWKQQNNKTKNHLIVFDAVWWNSQFNTTKKQLLLIACTNTGEIIVWKQHASQVGELGTGAMEYESTRPGHFNNGMDLSDGPSSRMSPTPFARIQVSTGVLYSMKMVTLPSQKAVLMVSGDEGILILDWTTWWTDKSQLASSSSSGIASLETSIPLPRLAKFQTYPSPHERGASVEINDFDLLLHSHYVIGAAGDAFGAYKWNLETQQLVATYPTALQPSSSGRRHHCSHTYMHSVKTLHSNNHANDDKLVLMGGEGGILSLWDGQQDKRIESWNLGTTPTTTSSNSLAKSATGATTWISSIDTLSDDTWWMAGGGMAGTGSSTNIGFWSAFHGPTRSRITVPTSSSSSPYSPHKHQVAQPPQTHLQQQFTRAPITKIVSTESTASWYSVGLEGVVRQWSLTSSLDGYDSKSNRGVAVASSSRRQNNNSSQPTNLEHGGTSSRSKAVWCDLPCAYAIAFSNSEQHRQTEDGDDDNFQPMVAIGGVGSFVNVFKDYNGVLVADQSLSI